MDVVFPAVAPPLAVAGRGNVAGSGVSRGNVAKNARRISSGGADAWAGTGTRRAAAETSANVLKIIRMRSQSRDESRACER